MLSLGRCPRLTWTSAFGAKQIRGAAEFAFGEKHNGRSFRFT